MNDSNLAIRFLDGDDDDVPATWEAECVLHFAKTVELYPGVKWEEILE